MLVTDPIQQRTSFTASGTIDDSIIGMGHMALATDSRDMHQVRHNTEVASTEPNLAGNLLRIADLLHTCLQSGCTLRFIVDPLLEQEILSYQKQQDSVKERMSSCRWYYFAQT